MKRAAFKIFKCLGILILILALIVGGVLLFWKPFGKTPSKNMQDAYAKRTDYFYDGTFHQPEDFTVLTEYEGEKSTPADDRYPTEKIPVEKITDFPENPNGEWNVTWFGHSTVMLQIDDKKVFIDPMLSEYSSPIQAFYGKRMAELPMEAEDIPEVDVVVFSHDHYDHLDYNTIKKIDSKVKEYIVPLGVDQHLIRWGVDEEKIHTVAWWEDIEVSGIKFTSTPAQHYSGRLPWKNNTTLFSGYVMQKDDQQIYYTGDTGYGEFFKEINKRFGKMDLVIMENGQYDKMWADCHMMPEEGVEAAKILQADVVLPVHWAGFVLSNHGWKEPIERYTAAAKKENISVITPIIGESVGKNDISDHMNSWWENINGNTDEDADADDNLDEDTNENISADLNTVNDNVTDENVAVDLNGNSVEVQEDLTTVKKGGKVSSKSADNVEKMVVTVGDTTFTATLENNEAVTELIQMMKEKPVTLELSDYSGFEKVGPLGKSLTTSNKQTTTQDGDIVLYSGNQIVVFYGSNSWSYTRLAKIDDLTGWREALGNGDVTVTFSIS